MDELSAGVRDCLLLKRVCFSSYDFMEMVVSELQVTHCSLPQSARLSAGLFAPYAPCRAGYHAASGTAPFFPHT